MVQRNGSLMWISRLEGPLALHGRHHSRWRQHKSMFPRACGHVFKAQKRMGHA